MKKYLILVLTAVLICGCGGKSGKGGSVFMMPTSTGVPYEILLVADSEDFQNGVVGVLTDVLEDVIPGLPQGESAFKVSKVTSENYHRNLRFCRNIIMVNVDRTFTAPKMKFSRNVYSDPQIIMTMQAPDDKSLINFIRQNGDNIVDFFTKAEMNREIELLRKKHSLVIQEKVQKQFECDVWVPGELVKMKTGRDFFWATTDRGERDMSFVVYSFPYTDVNTFTPEYFFDKRDSVMRENIPGPREGQYMQTARPYVSVTDSELRGRYAQIARGLWEMKDYDMGGPFVSVSRVDEKNQKVIVAEGFVYAPGDEKKNLMRRMEAAVYSLQLPDEIDERNFSFAIEEVTVEPEN